MDYMARRRILDNCLPTADEPCLGVILDSLNDDQQKSVVAMLKMLASGKASQEEKEKAKNAVYTTIRSAVNFAAVKSAGVVAKAKPDVLPLDKSMREILASAANYAIRMYGGKVVHNKSGNMDIIIDKNGIKHALSRKAGLIDALASTDLETMLKNATYLSRLDDRKSRKEIKNVYLFGADVEIAGKEVTIGIYVREHQDGKRYYDHFELKMRSPHGAGFGGSSPGGHEGRSSGANTVATSTALSSQPASEDNNILDAALDAVNMLLSDGWLYSAGNKRASA